MKKGVEQFEGEKTIEICHVVRLNYRFRDHIFFFFRDTVKPAAIRKVTSTIKNHTISVPGQHNFIVVKTACNKFCAKYG